MSNLGVPGDRAPVRQQPCICGAYFIALGVCFVIFNALFNICGTLFIRFLFLCMRCLLHYRRYFMRSVQTSLYSVLSSLYSVSQYFWSSALQREHAPSFIQSRPTIHIPLDHRSRKENACFPILRIQDGGLCWRGGQDGFDGSYSSETRYSPPN